MMQICASQYWKQQVQLANQFLQLIDRIKEFQLFVRPEGAASFYGVFGGRALPHVVEGGGCILMRHGTAVRPEDDIRQIINGVCKSFHVAKNVQFCHSDIRVNNIMRFNGHVQLIDYGLSGPSGEICRLCAGARQDKIGARLAGCSVHETVAWHQSDDYEMLLAAVVKLLSKR